MKELKIETTDIYIQFTDEAGMGLSLIKLTPKIYLKIGLPYEPNLFATVLPNRKCFLVVGVHGYILEPKEYKRVEL